MATTLPGASGSTIDWGTGVTEGASGTTELVTESVRIALKV
jgi:hypothetical protein